MMVRLAKVRIDISKIRDALELPDDVEVSSVYTERDGRGQRSRFADVYMTSDRFEEIGEYETAPEITLRVAKNGGMWDEDSNEG